MKMFTGIDIIEVNRVKEAMIKNLKLKNRIFTNKEIEYCEKKSELTKYQSYAARFAAKEAFYKAISGLLDKNDTIEWNNIEVIDNQNGRPYIKIINNENIEKKLEKYENDVSLSHIKEYATAIVIVNRKED